MENERVTLTTFRNLTRATRLKTEKDGKLRKPKCPNCHKVDSWQQYVQCYEIATSSIRNEKQRLAKIEAIMERTHTESPANGGAIGEAKS